MAWGAGMVLLTVSSGGPVVCARVGTAERTQRLAHLAPSRPTTTAAPISASSAAQKPDPNRRRLPGPSSAQSQPGGRSAAGAEKRMKRPGTTVMTPPLSGLAPEGSRGWR